MRLRGQRTMFQSLTRDSNHSNSCSSNTSIIAHRFQSLTRDSNHSNRPLRTRHAAQRSFNPSRGIAIIQTISLSYHRPLDLSFQSLTRDSNHSNAREQLRQLLLSCFNPSRGIAIIQTAHPALGRLRDRVSIPHAG